tara:strand:- start:533 stop:943 length:411 start_codon:yes stop_codon:yes gene_type:complete
MNFRFELNTTISEPLHIAVDSSNTTMKELYTKLYDEIAQNTIFQREDILDIFAQDGLSNGTLSIPASDQLVKDFIPMNRTYFPYDLISKNIYKLYVIDRMYNEQLKIPYQESKKREIKTTPMGGFIETVKEILSFK